MEDQQAHDIASNPPRLSQEKCIQDSTQMLIFPKWSALPPIVIEKIYSYLGGRDRSQMSLVCRKWCQEYSAPSLWRTMKVTFPQTLQPGDVCQAVRYTQKYGYAFRHVEINCKVVGLREASLMENQLKEFLEALICFSQLSSVSFINMFFLYNRHNNQVFKDILPTIISFLLSQNKVESIRFQYSTFSIPETLEVLKAIFANSNGTLKHLTLTEFSEDMPHEDLRTFVIHMPSTHDILMNLRKIEIDYSHILESLIISCYEYGSDNKLPNKMGRLEEMKIYCDDNEWVDYQGIPPDAWKYFTRICPSLRINLLYGADYEDECRFETFIVRHMPVKIMDFEGEINHELHSETGTCRLFSHLLSCEVNLYLEEMTIMWVNNTKNLHSDLINFLQNCHRLSKLDLGFRHPVEALDMIFSSMLCNRPSSLENVYMTIQDIPTKQDESNYLYISDYFAPLLLDINIMLTLCTGMKYGKRKDL